MTVNELIEELKKALDCYGDMPVDVRTEFFTGAEPKVRVEVRTTTDGDALRCEVTGGR